jgi:hypothetical protein
MSRKPIVRHVLWISIHLTEEHIMPNSKDASGLHKQAANDHQEAAKNHLKAAECHDKNNLSDAKDSSKSAMNCCNTAHKSTEAACSKTAD